MESGFVRSSQPSLLCSMVCFTRMQDWTQYVPAFFFFFLFILPLCPLLFFLNVCRKKKSLHSFQDQPLPNCILRCLFAVLHIPHHKYIPGTLRPGGCNVGERDITGEKFKTSGPDSDPFELNRSCCMGFSGSKLVCFTCRSIKLKSKLFKRLHCFLLVLIVSHVKFYIFFHNKYMKQLIQCYIV